MNISLVYIFRDGWMPGLGGSGKRGGQKLCEQCSNIYGVTLIKALRNNERVHVTLINSQPVEHDVFVLIN